MYNIYIYIYTHTDHRDLVCMLFLLLYGLIYSPNALDSLYHESMEDGLRRSRYGSPSFIKFDTCLMTSSTVGTI